DYLLRGRHPGLPPHRDVDPLRRRRRRPPGPGAGLVPPPPAGRRRRGAERGPARRGGGRLLQRHLVGAALRRLDLPEPRPDAAPRPAAGRRVDRPGRRDRAERPGDGDGRERGLRREGTAGARRAEPAPAAPDAVSDPAAPIADHNCAALHEAVAAAVGDRDCLVAGGITRTWAEVTDRTRRLAAVLADAGIGLRRPPTEVAPWESPHDHVALYLHNGHEYLEGMIGAWKARAASVNVNYRYVAGELAHVLRDSGAVAVVYHGAFAATLAEVLPELPQVRLLLQVDDGSGAPLLPGARWYEEALAAATPRPPRDLSPDDRYVLYTGGTTGRPKGTLWRQGDFLATALGVRGTVDELVAAARRRTDLRVLPSAPFMHG